MGYYKSGEGLGVIGCIFLIVVLSLASALFTLALYFLVFQALLKYVTGS